MEVLMYVPKKIQENIVMRLNVPESYEEAMSVISREELDELDALGDSRDDTRWLIGFKAIKYIDDWNWPAMIAYQVIGSRSDYRVTSVRSYCRVARFWTQPGYDEFRDEFNYLRFSIFAHAMRTEKPKECLMYAQQHGLRRPGELVELYPAVVQDEDDPDPVPVHAPTIPLWARPVQRRIDQVQDPFKQKLLQNIYLRLVHKVKELSDEE